MITPIQRLPIEILIAIFSLYRYKNVPLELLWVCRWWRRIALATPHLWSKFRLCTWTTVAKVAFILDRTVTSPLNVEISTDADTPISHTPTSPPYAALLLAATEAKRWRRLSIRSYPPEDHMNSDEYLKKLPSALNGQLEGLRVLKMKVWHYRPVPLLFIIPFLHNKITSLILDEPTTLDYIIQPQFVAIFHALVICKISHCTEDIMIDILTQFRRLETLDLAFLNLPSYPVETDLQLVRTLKYMKIEGASVQWMAGHKFPNLKECLIIDPLHPEMISPRRCVNLPICTNFTYDAQCIDTITNFCIPILDVLTIRADPDIGGSELAALWSAAPGKAALHKPRVLHLRTGCRDEDLIEVLSKLPGLEEFHLRLLYGWEHDGLGTMFFTSLQAEEKKGWNTQAATHECRLCPNLTTLSICYDWLRCPDKPDIVTPKLNELVESRWKTSIALQNVKFWHSLVERGDNPIIVGDQVAYDSPTRYTSAPGQG